MKKLASPMVIRGLCFNLSSVVDIPNFIFKDLAMVTSSCWNSDNGAISLGGECRSDHGGLGSVTATDAIEHTTGTHIEHINLIYLSNVLFPLFHY
jgi:hypothetical protein